MQRSGKIDLKLASYIDAGDVEGTVSEVSFFSSTIVTIDNVTTIVANNKIFSDNVKNHFAKPRQRRRSLLGKAFGLRYNCINGN